MPRSVRVAAIDIGSNAVRLCIANVSAGEMDVIAEDRVPTQLARGLDKTGKLHAPAVAPTLAAAGAFLALAKKLGTDKCRIVATAAVREARDGGRFITRASQRLRHAVEVLTPEEEGAIAFLSLSRRFDLSRRPAAVIDIGGGSVQIVLSQGGIPYRVVSMPLGAVRLTDAFGGPGSAAGARAGELRTHIDRTLKEHLGELPRSPAVVLGTGGTVTTIASLAGRLGLIRVESVRRLLREFTAAAPDLPAFARLLTADRVGIAFAGFTVLDRVLRRLHAGTLHAHTGGVREGLCWGLAERAPRSEMAAVRAYASAVRYEEPHSEQVTRLSLSLFDQLAGTTTLQRTLSHEPRARLLLEASAVLHDIGVRIGYAEHHKHGRDMVLCSRLPGFSPRELSIIAQVVRYHRKQEPTPEHRRFGALAPRDRSLVETLAAVLRLGDALDRSHKQPVQRLRLRVERGVVRVKLTLTPTGDVREEFKAVRKKGKLFERVWKSRVEIEL